MFRMEFSESNKWHRHQCTCCVVCSLEICNLEEWQPSLGLSQVIYINLVFLRDCSVVLCICLNSSFLLSAGIYKKEELVASQRLIQIPVVFQ